MLERKFRLFDRQMESGFALVSALLLLMLMSAIGVALLYKVNYEQHSQRTDSGNNLAYYGAEAGMEKMMSDLSSLYASQAAPTWCSIQNLANNPPAQSDVGVTYPSGTGYSISMTTGTPPTGCGVPPSRSQIISQGPNAGLMAQIVPLSISVTADRPGGEEVSMIRQVEVASIPVFQFGVFSDSDLSFFAGPAFDFTGRVHTNGNLFLAEGSGQNLTFHTPIRAAKDIVRDQIANGASTSTQGRTGTVLVPTGPNGCPTTNCRALSLTGPNEGSSVNGPSTTYGGTGTPNTSVWPTLSRTTYNSMIMSGSTGATPLSMAFVKGGVNPIEILRKPKDATEDPTSDLAQSRLYNQAQIRVLLVDDPAEFPPLGAADVTGDAAYIRLANFNNGSGPDYSTGVPVGGSANHTYFAEAKLTTDGNWVTPTTNAVHTLLGQGADANAPIIGGGPDWNLLDGYLRVEYRRADGVYVGVTKEWLELGFARAQTPPTDASPNPVNPNAILILQEKADRNANGIEDPGTPASSTSSSFGPSANSCTVNPYTWTAPTTCSCSAGSTSGCTGGKGKKWSCSCSTPVAAVPAELATDAGTGTNVTGTATRNNWYPINMYDAREGELREWTAATAAASPTACTVPGVINLVEIDVTNLRRWLTGAIGTKGTSVEYTSQNGYILYVSDRRGMKVNPNAGNIKNGEYGFEDVINPGVASGDPDGALQAGEDSNGNAGSTGNLPETWGKANLGLGFGLAANPANPYSPRIACLTTARANWVSGARHGIRLVHGTQGNLPTRPDHNIANSVFGGFTLATENPAYILGDYNANITNGGWADGSDHASAAVIADTVTLLSNSWSDLNSFANPTVVNNRNAGTTWYRVAIASGKNKNFPLPTWAGSPGVPADYGTDGGVHNFLRFLEDWGGQTANYKGSMASLYYSQYATGVFKCCGTVYNAPTRNYAFDLDFTDINRMPPGTPTFRDVVNLGFQQVF
jgi:hypothetical protein